MARPSGRDIRREVIEAASQAIQSRGATGFSYGSIADELGITAPSIHHHFRRKDDLLTAAVAQYRAQFRQRVEALEGRSARERLEAYASLFLAPAQRHLLCLCGAVAADWNGIDAATRAEVEMFFDQEIAWVTAQATQAIDAGEFDRGVDAEAFATTFIGALEGALLLARMSKDHGALSGTAPCLLDLATNRTGDRDGPQPPDRRQP